MDGRRMDGRTDRRTDGRTKGRTDGGREVDDRLINPSTEQSIN